MKKHDKHRKKRKKPRTYRGSRFEVQVPTGPAASADRSLMLAIGAALLSGARRFGIRSRSLFG